jgi:uncharacterized protein YukJ
VANKYCCFKGTLSLGVPYLDGYNGNPHYAIIVQGDDGAEFVVLTNVKSDSTMPGAGESGYHVLYYWDQYFTHPMTGDLQALSGGLHQSDFPTLDYVHDQRLIGDLSRMRPIALDTENQHNDINGLVDQMLMLDRTQAPVDYLYHGQSGDDPRKGWRPSTAVTVYGFGFLFEPQENGLHETHMNQGNPQGQGCADHSRENGVRQDGAVLVEIDGKFQALLIAFQTQLVPTDNRGFPVRSAKPILSE